ncbi:Flagellin N-methylase [uncultured Defluviicoccus sp.]|uniref:Flagellin N-methylase n=1 Tax=metagenome TaxID=256318 RepID=A0A380T7Y4_9ZZZZ|nr:Flagellin N-methylase [uncultured Defluviicoccus sp.]
MSTGFSAAEEALYHKTARAVLAQLRKTGNPAALLPVLRVAQKRFDRAFDAAPAGARATVACRAGCGTCCHVPVGAQAHEVLIAAEYIQTHSTCADLEAVIARVAVHRAAFAGRTPDERLAQRRPCALLVEENCSIYGARPGSCRSHHSHDLDGCRTNLAAGIDRVDVLIPAIRGRMFAVMLAIDQAAEAAGFDAQAYDFGSALHEALTDSLCVVRWLRRQPAFSAACQE